MKILTIFDLHYIQGDSPSERKLDEIDKIEDEIGAVLLGGDNAEIAPRLRNHLQLIERLRRKYHKIPIGFICGNHDLWTRASGISAQEMLYEIFPEIAKQTGLIYLENENMQFPGLTIAGTYGHYDFSLRKPRGKVTLDDLRKGTFVIDLGNKRARLGWVDKEKIHLDGQTDEGLCKKLIEDFNKRLEEVQGKLITLSHTVPSRELVGYPDSPEQEFYGAYSGSILIGKVIEKSNSWLHLCGHTHAKAEATIGRTRVINVGADYDLVRYAIIDSEAKSVEIRERPV